MNLLYKLIIFFFVLTLSCAPKERHKIDVNNIALPEGYVLVDTTHTADTEIIYKTIDTVSNIVVPVKVEKIHSVDTVYLTKTLVETLTIIKREPTPTVKKITNTERFAIQIGAFRNKNNAINIHRKLKSIYTNVYIISKPPYWKVRIGNYRNKKEAINIKDKIKKRGFPDAFIISI